MDLTGDRSQKITPRHLRRQAYLYVRQSTLRQVVENTESTQRQYALRQRAVALGWPIEQVVVIDRDLGQSDLRPSAAAAGAPPAGQRAAGPDRVLPHRLGTPGGVARVHPPR
jgi:hypothetical protein